MRGVDYWWGTEESGALDRPAWSGRLVRVVGRIVDSSTGCAVLVVARSLVCVRRARGGPPARNGLGRFVGRTRGNLCLTLFLSVLPGVSFVRGLSRTSLGDRLVESDRMKEVMGSGEEEEEEEEEEE